MSQWAEVRIPAGQERPSIVAVPGHPAEGHVFVAVEQGLQHPLDSPEVWGERAFNWQGYMWEEPKSHMYNLIWYLKWERQKYSPYSDNILPRCFRIWNPDTCYRIIM